MTITFYILLGYLNLTKQRSKFSCKRLEDKLNTFFGIYTVLWLIAIGGAISAYFLFFPIFILLTIVSLWLIAELISDKAILIYGKNKEILQKEFMSVNEESLNPTAANGLTKIGSVITLGGNLTGDTTINGTASTEAENLTTQK